MKMGQILLEIRNLSYSQGFYGRLLRSLLELKDHNPDEYEEVKNQLEGQNFQDVVDMVLYFEQ